MRRTIVALALLVWGRCCISYASPREGGEKSQNVNTVPDWRATRPAPGPEPKAPSPVIERVELENGLVLLIHQRHDVPTVMLRAVVPAGKTAQPAGKEGLAALTVELCTQGSDKRDAPAVADDAALLGGELHAGASGDAAEISLPALAATLPQALELLGDVLTHPAFRPADVERTRAQMESRILERDDDPDATLSDAAMATAYGETHPYGGPALGTRESMAKLTRDDVMAFYRARYRPRGTALVLVGDVTPERARALVEAGPLGAWATGEAAPITPGPPAKAPPRGFVVVERPGAAQSAIAFVLPTVGLRDPDAVPLQLADACLGGVFSSRLNLNLREAHGYSYGAGSTILRARGPMVELGQTEVPTDVTLPAVGEIRAELRRLAAAPPDAAELDLARAQLVHGIIGAFETTEEASRAIADLFALGLPLDYYQRFAAEVASTTPERVKQALAAHLQADRATIVIVGDGAAFEPDLAVHRIK